ncbi:CRISPR type I-F/YPEST-associated protein Csy2 [Tepidimonas alkaliphilus]|uniref:CRISPR type I-F/YPEST-associated protein Csy2 n=1 Tax=Tepidimonas alkaliphilus TaxID=2588942 RepID=A0A554W3U3_9BURK|nr:type I-F CRISPR-associated protein Csy2 [Tepidimonas alkaliphilus]TSE18255.1 CRISPR type I-F/YPEST-associated protein Csy2 [Tepidimonas alkaliphilus]
MSYLILKHIRAHRANGLQTHYLAAPAPVFAACMLGHAIAARLGTRDLGVAIVHHRGHLQIDEWPSEAPARAAWQVRGASGPSSAPLENPIQPGVLAELDLSLIIKLERVVDLKQVEGILKAMPLRLAGSPIARLPMLMQTNDAHHALRSCGRGFVTLDARQYVQAKLDSGVGILDAMFHRTPGEAGWFVPATVGYSMLSRFEPRRNVRDQLPHAWAEALVGLVEYRSTFSFGENDSIPLWRHGWVDDQAFIVQQ